MRVAFLEQDIPLHCRNITLPHPACARPGFPVDLGLAYIWSTFGHKVPCISSLKPLRAEHRTAQSCYNLEQRGRCSTVRFHKLRQHHDSGAGFI